MIISKTPLRISFFSGGSDIPDFYEQDYGLALSASINKYNYVCVNDTRDGKIRFTHESVDQTIEINKIKNDIFRETLKYYDYEENFRPGISVTSISDINGKGTGLGSSSAFCVGLIKALVRNSDVLEEGYDPYQLAVSACYIELEKCEFPIGKQDAFAAAYGGFNRFKFKANGEVEKTPIRLMSVIGNDFENRLALFNTGIERHSIDILSKQTEATHDKDKYELIKRGRDKVDVAIDLLIDGKFSEVGELLHEAWLDKKQVTDNITSPRIDEIYDLGLNLGAIGGKLLGAGGGGHILFCLKPNVYKGEFAINMEKIFGQYGLRHVPFRFSFEGAKIINV